MRSLSSTLTSWPLCGADEDAIGDSLVEKSAGLPGPHVPPFFGLHGNTVVPVNTPGISSFGFVDPASGDTPGWPLRNFITLLANHLVSSSESFSLRIGMSH